MDHLDEKIFTELRDDARLSFTELGRRVGLSTNATASRVRRLEAEGVIAGYTIVPGRNQPTIAGGLEVFIDLRLDAASDDASFTAAISGWHQIIDAVHLTGPYDYLVHAVVADTAALDALVKQLKSRCGVAQTQTRVALRAPRFD